jgi:branched-chain amino acid transport system permease protein
VVIATAIAYRTSPAGLKLRASKEDPLAAAALGADVQRLRLGAWIVSGAIMGCGGALWSQYNLAFNAEAFYFTQTFALLAMVVIGGLATVSGAVLGTVAVVAASDFLRRAQAGLDLGVVELHLPTGSSALVLSLWILLILYRWPDGVAGMTELGDRIARWLPLGSSPRKAPASTDAPQVTVP